MWINELGHHNQKQELAQQHKYTEDLLCENNRAILEIIPLNTMDDYHFSPSGSPISYDELIVDSSTGGPHSE